MYKIICECGKIYIGQTGRTVQKRFQEHKNNAKNNRKNHSSISDHLRDSNCNPDKCKVNLIRECNKGKKLNVLEQLEIDRHKNKELLNTQLESYVTTLTTPPILLSSYKKNVVKTSDKELTGREDESRDNNCAGAAITPDL